MADKRVESVWWTMRVMFGVVPIVAGLDKFVGLLANWEAYLSPLARQVIPVSPTTFMHLVGIIEIAAGVIVLVRPRIGAIIVSLWLVGIALNLVSSGHYLDVAVRDLVMAVSAFCLARLSAAREATRVPEARPAAVGSGAPVAARA